MFLLICFCFLRFAREWPTLGGNNQHTGISPNAAVACINNLRWNVTIDTSGDPRNTHYGTPLVTSSGTVIEAIRTTAQGDFLLNAFDGMTGSVIWSFATGKKNYPFAGPVVPQYLPVLDSGVGAAQRIYFAGPGGTVFFRTNPDNASGTVTQLFPQGEAEYLANKAFYDGQWFINSGLVVDSNDAVIYAVKVSPNPGTGSFMVRIDQAGNVITKTVPQLTATPGYVTFPEDFVPAFSNDGTIMYSVVTDGANPSRNALILGLSPTTLDQLNDPSSGNPMEQYLEDPQFAGVGVNVNDQSTSCPTVGPDDDVYFGALGGIRVGQRINGWLLRFDKHLQMIKSPPGPGGWDDTPTVVPSNLVPSYNGNSAYLMFLKINDYFDFTDNLLVLVDPNDVGVDPLGSGVPVMKIVLQIGSPTPNPAVGPFAFREWCINQGALDPTTGLIYVNNEDSKLWAWDINTNTFVGGVLLGEARQESYTPTVIAPDGSIMTINWGTLNRVDCVQSTVSTTEPPTTSSTTAATTTTTIQMTTTAASRPCQTVDVRVGTITVTNTFTPESVDVQIGDTVLFTWDGGFHNVYHTDVFR